MGGESLPQQDKPLEMDPRQKKGMGLDFWASAMLKNGIISQKEFDEFIAKNNAKEEMMEKFGVPQLKHYGTFNSTQEIKEKLASVENQHFIIRCKSKDNEEQIMRLIDTDLDGACAFADKLPGGFEKWVVEMKEFEPNTIAAGTIIVEPSAITSVEMWKGPHYLGATNSPKYHGEFDPNQFQHSFQWKAPEGADDLQDYQNYAIDALRYIFPHIKPRPNEPIYTEFGVRPNGEIYFIEVNDSVVVTGRSKAQEE